MQRRASLMLGFASCALALTCVYLWRELDHERDRSAELWARLQAATSAPASTRAGDASRPTRAAVAPQPGTATSAPPVEASTPRTVTGRQEDWEAYQRRMMRDPRYREVQRDQTRLALAPRRANMIRLLGFTPEQADAVIDLQIEREWQQAEQLSDPPTEDSKERQRQLAERQEKEYQAKILEMLGQQKQSNLQHYMETRSSRMQVDTFRTQLNGADMLREDQVEPLIEALHVERAQYLDQLSQYRETLNWDGTSNDSWQRYAEKQSELMKGMNAAMHSSAVAILSTSQLAQLDAMLSRDLQRHEARTRMTQLQGKIDGAAALQPN